MAIFDHQWPMTESISYAYTTKLPEKPCNEVWGASRVMSLSGCWEHTPRAGMQAWCSLPYLALRISSTWLFLSYVFNKSIGVNKLFSWVLWVVWKNFQTQREGCGNLWSIAGWSEVWVFSLQLASEVGQSCGTAPFTYGLCADSGYCQNRTDLLDIQLALENKGNHVFSSGEKNFSLSLSMKSRNWSCSRYTKFKTL